MDRTSGTGEDGSYFFLELTNNRIAMLACEHRSTGCVSLYLVVRAGGRVDWEDYEQVMEPLGIPLEEVARQGGLVWRRRGPKRESP